MEKYTVIAKRPYEFVGTSGDTITGFMYSAFCEDGMAIEFSSKRDDIKITRSMKFDPAKAQELDIEARVFNGKVKYRELEAEIGE